MYHVPNIDVNKHVDDVNFTYFFKTLRKFYVNKHGHCNVHFYISLCENVNLNEYAKDINIIINLYANKH